MSSECSSALGAPPDPQAWAGAPLRWEWWLLTGLPPQEILPHEMQGSTGVQKRSPLASVQDQISGAVQTPELPAGSG